MNIIGVTATQKGLTLKQLAWFGELFAPGDVLHHGCCIGGDAQIHWIARQAGCYIVGHPPTDQRKVDRGVLSNCDALCTPLPYLERNHEMVLATEKLCAGPRESTEVLRSGTWATIRFARAPNVQRPTYIIYPNGDLEMPNKEIRSPTGVCTLCAAQASEGFFTGCMVKQLGIQNGWDCDGRGTCIRVKARDITAVWPLR